MKHYVVALLFSLGLWACSPYTLLDSKVLNNADLAAYKTYQIATPQDGKLPVQLNNAAYQNIAAAIRKQMQIRGYQEASNSPLLINIGIVVNDNIETKSAVPPSYSPYFLSPRAAYYRNYYQGAQLITNINKEGVLTIDMVDRRDNKYLYTASVGNLIDRADDKVKDMTQVDDAMAALFRNFPVKPIE